MAAATAAASCTDQVCLMFLPLRSALLYTQIGTKNTLFPEIYDIISCFCVGEMPKYGLLTSANWIKQDDKPVY
uniref:Uncharacterized protein n=1 Tax=White spot syndrome virus TaxID=342409 RepID=A0A6B9MPH8_9VIRU|nr:hypothetical protein [White spot syndrome virus]